MKKIISLILIITFSWNQLAYAAGDTPFSALRPAATVMSKAPTALAAELLENARYASPQRLQQILMEVEQILSRYGETLPQIYVKRLIGLKNRIRRTLAKTRQRKVISWAEGIRQMEEFAYEINRQKIGIREAKYARIITFGESGRAAWQTAGYNWDLGGAGKNTNRVYNSCLNREGPYRILFVFYENKISQQWAEFYLVRVKENTDQIDYEYYKNNGIKLIGKIDFRAIRQRKQQAGQGDDNVSVYDYIEEFRRKYLRAKVIRKKSNTYRAYVVDVNISIYVELQPGYDYFDDFVNGRLTYIVGDELIEICKGDGIQEPAETIGSAPFLIEEAQARTLQDEWVKLTQVNPKTKKKEYIPKNGRLFFKTIYTISDKVEKPTRPTRIKEERKPRPAPEQQPTIEKAEEPPPLQPPVEKAEEIKAEPLPPAVEETKPEPQKEQPIVAQRLAVEKAEQELAVEQQKRHIEKATKALIKNYGAIIAGGEENLNFWLAEAANRLSTLNTILIMEVLNLCRHKNLNVTNIDFYEEEDENRLVIFDAALDRTATQLDIKLSFNINTKADINVIRDEIEYWAALSRTASEFTKYFAQAGLLQMPSESFKDYLVKAGKPFNATMFDDNFLNIIKKERITLLLEWINLIRNESAEKITAGLVNIMQKEAQYWQNRIDDKGAISRQDLAILAREAALAKAIGLRIKTTESHSVSAEFAMVAEKTKAQHKGFGEIYDYYDFVATNTTVRVTTPTYTIPTGEKPKAPFKHKKPRHGSSGSILFPFRIPIISLAPTTAPLQHNQQSTPFLSKFKKVVFWSIVVAVIIIPLLYFTGIISWYIALKALVKPGAWLVGKVALVDMLTGAISWGVADSIGQFLATKPTALHKRIIKIAILVFAGALNGLWTHILYNLPDFLGISAESALNKIIRAGIVGAGGFLVSLLFFTRIESFGTKVSGVIPYEVRTERKKEADVLLYRFVVAPIKTFLLINYFPQYIRVIFEQVWDIVNNTFSSYLMNRQKPLFFYRIFKEKKENNPAVRHCAPLQEDIKKAPGSPKTSPAGTPPMPVFPEVSLQVIVQNEELQKRGGFTAEQYYTALEKFMKHYYPDEKAPSYKSCLRGLALLTKEDFIKMEKRRKGRYLPDIDKICRTANDINAPVAKEVPAEIRLFVLIVLSEFIAWSFEEDSVELAKVLMERAKSREHLVSVLIAALKHRNPSIRKNAVCVLYGLGAKGAINALIEAMVEDDNEIGCRARVFRVFQDPKWKTAEAFEPLTKVLWKVEGVKRTNAIYALVNIGGEKAVSFLIDIFNKEKDDPTVLNETFMFLEEFATKGNREAIKFIKKVANDKAYREELYESFREEAQKILKRIKTPKSSKTSPAGTKIESEILRIVHSAGGALNIDEIKAEMPPGITYAQIGKALDKLCKEGRIIRVDAALRKLLKYSGAITFISPSVAILKQAGFAASRRREEKLAQAA